MLRTVADLLEALMAKEQTKLPSFDKIGHAGLFGEMYEGLTKALLDRALFEGMDLRVASGKIRNSKGILSCEIDCMVVLGPGEPIPHTDSFIYPFEKVVMVVEVKKTLYGADLEGAMDLFRQLWKEVAEARPPQTGLFPDAWRALMKAHLPSRDQIDSLPFHEQMIYHTLSTEAVLPLRVIFGYDGYIDEFTLREGMVNYLRKIIQSPMTERPRFNVNTFPNLIVCRKASLVKLDGMPYSGRIDERGFWWWMGSRGSNPFHVLLELLWTRLDYIFKLGPDIFGEDLETDTINLLLGGKAEPLGARAGWRYEEWPLTRHQLNSASSQEAWHPPVLNNAEYALVNDLCRGREVDLTDEDLIAFLKDEGETVASITASLNQKMLATIEGQRLKLLTDECTCMILPDGRMVAAENKSGRLTRYAMKVLEETRKRPQ